MVSRETQTVETVEPLFLKSPWHPEPRAARFLSAPCMVLQLPRDLPANFPFFYISQNQLLLLVLEEV